MNTIFIFLIEFAPILSPEMSTYQSFRAQVSSIFIFYLRGLFMKFRNSSHNELAFFQLNNEIS